MKNKGSDLETSKLNGAQISSLLSIIQFYTTGAISRSAAISIVTSTLGISRENAESFIKEQIKQGGVPNDSFSEQQSL